MLEPPDPGPGRPPGVVRLGGPGVGERVGLRPGVPVPPATGTWTSWHLPGDAATYAVYVDDTDAVWLSDFNANAIVRFDPATETFTEIPLPARTATSARSLAGPARCGEPSRPPTNSSSSAARPARRRRQPADVWPTTTAIETR